MDAAPDWTAQMDQAIVAVRDLARGAAAMYKTLVEEGVPERAATAIVGAYMAGLVTGTSQSGGDDA